MDSLPKALKKIVNFFEGLPGIGPKTAKRLAFYLLRIPQKDLEDFGKTLIEFKKKLHYCPLCFNFTEERFCLICQDAKRDKTTITVVEEVLDLLAIEAAKKYQGVYHVLHGRIDPLNYIGPEDIYINNLLKRIDKNTKEIILATNPNMEGEATAIYIKKKLLEIKEKHHFTFKITRLAYGLPLGADIEYADYLTLQKALEGRQNY